MIAAPDAYRHLRARAADLLAAAGGSMDAVALAAELFAGSGRAVAEPLLDAVLADDPRFRRGPASWALATDQQPAAAPGQTVVAIAIATTGADHRRHRIVRLAGVRIGSDGVISRLDLVVTPGRRLARYLVDGARLALDEVDQAPTFAEVTSELREFIRDDDLHAYGAGWTGSFLEAELARADQPGLTNRLVEIDDLALGVVASGRKPGLASLAAALGLVHPRPGVPIVDAEVAARVVLALRDRATPGSSVTAQPDLERPCFAPAGPLLARGWLATVPTGPGVYLLQDQDGQPLYVGKAVNLRRRLAAYLGRAPAFHRQLEALSTRAARVEVRETASDLEATLLEARLLADLAPPFNVARRTHRPATYIRMAPFDDPPRVRLVRESASDGASYVGPLRSARVAQQVVTTARCAFPEAFLRRTVDVERQRAAVLAVSRLLGGQKDGALASLRGAMARCAATGDRAGVDRARAALRAVQRLTIEPSALIGLGDGSAVLIVERRDEPAARVHLVTGGRHLGSTDVDLSTWRREPQRICDLAQEIMAATAATQPASETPLTDPAAADTIDESSLIARWLAQSRSVVGVYRVRT